MRTLLILIAISIFLSCKKDKGEGCQMTETCKKVDIYLLQSHQLFSGKCAVDPSTVVLEELPLVDNTEIVKYAQTTHEYTVTNAAIEKLKALNPRTPFAVTVDKKIVFLAIHMPQTMSSTCDHSIAMSISGPNKFFLTLGYPGGLYYQQNITDLRNDPLLIAALSCQGKLER